VAGPGEDATGSGRLPATGYSAAGLAHVTPSWQRARVPYAWAGSALNRCRVLGTAGSVLLAVGSVAAGAIPVRDPFTDVAVLAALRREAGLGLVTAIVGLGLLVTAWWRLGRLVRHGEVSPPTLVATLAAWLAPVLVAVPIFSRDVYSYLAQGAMVDAGLDVYRHGPAVLGGPLAAEVPSVWQHTPTPYGPVFLLLAAGVTAVTGTHLVLGVLAMRLVALLGVVLLAGSLPALARRCGVDPSKALWLGVLNPLVPIHLIGGAHNDALMVGLLAAGLNVTLARRPVLGAALVTAAALVKLPAAAGLIFIVPVWAGQLAGMCKAVRAGLGTGLVAIGTAAVTTVAAGTGYGWVTAAVSTPVSKHNWSVSSALGRATRMLLEVIAPDVAGHALPMWRGVGLAAAAAGAVLAWRRRHQLGAVYALGLALGAIVIFGPALRPWYLLWSLVPLAAGAPDGLLRDAAAGTTAVLALSLLPSGFAPDGDQLAQVAFGAGIALVVILGGRHRAAIRRMWGRTAGSLGAAGPPAASPPPDAVRLRG
jgi:hypothetical protein